MLATFNFLVTGDIYTVKAFWDDTNGGSVCGSGSVTVNRVGAGTSVPTNTAAPTATSTTPAPSTATRTPTTPANTATPTPSATVTPVPPSATATATVPPSTATNTSAPTNTPTATGTPTATPTPSELFFSEYVEGSLQNNAVEIYNGTGSAVNLAAGNYDVRIYRSGSPTVNQTLDLAGTIANGAVWVVCDNGASATLQNLSDQIIRGTWFNGDDAVGLYHNGVLIDAIGQIGFDPGTGWGSGSTSTRDHTLRRKSNIIAGDTNGYDVFDPSVEWDGFPQDDFSGLGTR